MITINSNFSKKDIKNTSKFLTSLSPIEFAALASLIGLLIASPINSYEQNSIGNFLELVGQVILTVQAQNSLFSSRPISNDDFNKFKQEIYNFITTYQKSH